MCGIFGYIDPPETQTPSDIAPKFLKALHHRGPDGHGVQKIKNGKYHLTLGHTRLSVIDIKGGAQPFGRDDFWLTYNGEVFNFQDLRKDLKQSETFFATNSDTEVVFNLLKEKGETATSELNGMFAFAFWNPFERKLLLARDRHGIKPLYYYFDGKTLVFSSELSSLFLHPKVRLRPEKEGIGTYFYHGYNLPPLTPYKNIFQLAPGSQLIWHEGKITTEPYFQMALENPHPCPFNEAKDRTRRLIRESVARQMISDVPLGVFLSGGIDSSIVSFEAARISKRKLKTFSIGFKDKSFDESSHAKKMAKMLETDHHELVLNEDILLEGIDKILDDLPHPFADYSIVPTTFLSKLAREHVTVALGGDGADEFFGGYPTYKAFHYAKVLKLIPYKILKDFINPLIGELAVKDEYQSLEWKLKRFFHRYLPQDQARHLSWMSVVALSELNKISDEGACLKASEELIKGTRRDQGLNRILSLDQRSFMIHNVLAKVDTASMAYSLEVRPPFLDNNLTDYIRSLPGHYKVKGRCTKYLLKESYRGDLPDDILFRSKHGFSVNLAHWMRGPLKQLVEQTLQDASFFDFFQISKPYFKQSFERHIHLQEDTSRVLWALVVLRRHYQRVANG